MNDPYSIERLLESSATSAMAIASIGGPLRHYGGGAPALSDDQLRPLLLAYIQRMIEADPIRSDPLRYHGTEAIFGAPARHGYEQGSLALGAQIRPTLFSEHPAAVPYDLDLLETKRSDIASLARFSHRVDYANWHFCAALDSADEPIQWPKAISGIRMRTKPRSYFAIMAAGSFERWRGVRAILTHAWTPSEEVQSLCRAGFWSLCELTPADSQLKQLFETNPVRACHELVRHVDVVAEQLKMTTRLAEELTADDRATVEVEDCARLDAVQSDLLSKAGARLSLTQAAERLAITRQALHKKIKTGAALALMIGDTFVLPEAQLVSGPNGTTIVRHLRDVLSLFTEAGAGEWSALQYLIEVDPALGGSVPLDRLKEGDAKIVAAAARAYLGLDDG